LKPQRGHHDLAARGRAGARYENQIFGTIVHSCVSKMQHNEQGQVRMESIQRLPCCFRFDVRLGSLADMTADLPNIRITPESGNGSKPVAG
jgi:hypothetical protein